MENTCIVISTQLSYFMPDDTDITLADILSETTGIPKEKLQEKRLDEAYNPILFTDDGKIIQYTKTNDLTKVILALCSENVEDKVNKENPDDYRNSTTLFKDLKKSGKKLLGAFHYHRGSFSPSPSEAIQNYSFEAATEYSHTEGKTLWGNFINFVDYYIKNDKQETEKIYKEMIKQIKGDIAGTTEEITKRAGE